MYFIHFVLSTIILSSCMEKTTRVSIKIQAVNEKNRAITNAHVYLNEHFEGRTNSQGEFTFNKSVNPRKKLFFEVKKNSEALYYAPYYENFVFKEKTKKIQIKATLYSVPKPQFKDEKEPEHQPSSADSNANKAVPIAENKPRQLSPNDNKLSVKDETKENKDPIQVVSPKIIPLTHEDKNKDNKETKRQELTTNPMPDSQTKLVRGETGQEDPINVYIRTAKGPLAKAQVYYSNGVRGDLNLACTSNTRGRCQFKDPIGDGSNSLIVVKAAGYITSKKTWSLAPGAKVHFTLDAGHSIDIQTLISHYGHKQGLAGVAVQINGKSVGETDEFGMFIGRYQGPKGDLVELTLTSREHIPESFSTDYIIGGNVSLLKYFGTMNPQPVRVATVPVQVAGRLQGKTLSTFTGNLSQVLAKSLNRNFFNSPAFISTANDLMLKDKPKNLMNHLKKGWQNSQAKSEIDAVLVPTITMHDPMILELSIIDSTGQVLAAGKEDIANFSDRPAINKAIESLAEKILRRFPFQGTITAESSGLYTINLGYGEGRGVQIGDIFDIYGLKRDLKGQSKKHANIAQAQVTQAMEYSSRVKLIKIEDRAAVDIGDSVSFVGQASLGPNKIHFVVSDSNQNEPVSQANIYFKGIWIGSTDSNGILKTNKHEVGRGLLKIIKHGYETFSKETKLGTRGKLEVPLKRVSAFVQVDSEPQGMSVFIDKRFVGKTPLEEAVGVPSGFSKLEILGEDGYKNHMQILELDSGTLDLSGDRRIIMERDFQTEAKTLVDQGKFQEAIAVLKGVPESHSDYLNSRHLLGVIYMTLTQNPAKAAESFHLVTRYPDVKSFQNKRFISSHVNEGIALYLTAKNLLADSEEETAAAHMVKSLEVLSKAAPHLRFIAKDEYQKAYENLYYYMALAHQNLWDISGAKDHLFKAQTSWQTLLDSSDSTTKTPLMKNAEIYLKQVEIALNQGKGQNI